MRSRERAKEIQVVATEKANPAGDLEVFGGLARLVEQSLLRQVEGIDGAPRFVMLETIREFGLERLAAGSDEARVRDAHAQFFRVLGQDVHRDFAERRAQWLPQLVAEADNQRAALAWADRRADVETGLALAAALAHLVEHRGGLAEAQHWLSRFLASEAPPSLLQAQALFHASIAALHLGDAAAALARANEGAAIAQAVGTDLDVGYARLSQGMSLYGIRVITE